MLGEGRRELTFGNAEAKKVYQKMGAGTSRTPPVEMFLHQVLTCSFPSQTRARGGIV